MDAQKCVLSEPLDVSSVLVAGNVLSLRVMHCGGTVLACFDGDYGTSARPSATLSINGFSSPKDGCDPVTEEILVDATPLSEGFVATFGAPGKLRVVAGNPRGESASATMRADVMVFEQEYYDAVGNEPAAPELRVLLREETGELSFEEAASALGLTQGVSLRSGVEAMELIETEMRKGDANMWGRIRTLVLGRLNRIMLIRHKPGISTNFYIVGQTPENFLAAIRIRGVQ